MQTELKIQSQLYSLDFNIKLRHISAFLYRRQQKVGIDCVTLKPAGNFTAYEVMSVRLRNKGMPWYEFFELCL